MPDGLNFWKEKARQQIRMEEFLDNLIAAIAWFFVIAMVVAILHLA